MIAGIDEVGRGCWAGPLVAGAVVLRRPIAGVADSKALTKAQRERLDKLIRKRALGFGLGWVTVEELDRIGLTEAVRLAMRRAFDELVIACGEQITEVIIDGNYNYFREDARARALPKADATIAVVSAASIIAKVARDKWMAEHAALEFPQYQFEKHVGYGTALHRKLLAEHGVSSLHRRTWQPIQALLEA